MVRKIVQRKRVKKEPNAETEIVQDVSDNESKITSKDSNPTSQVQQKVKKESNAETEIVEDVSDNESKNTSEDSKPARQVQRKKVKKESNTETKIVEDVSDDDSKNTSKPARRLRKNVAQPDSSKVETNGEKSTSSAKEVKARNSKNKKDNVPITKYFQASSKNNEETSPLIDEDDEEKDKDTKGSKRKRRVKDDVSTTKRSKPAKKEEQLDSAKKPKNKTSSEFSTIDFSNESKTPAGNPWNFKISCWNINGIRAWLEKDGMSYLYHEKPDILCLQETKCSEKNLPDEVKNVDGYHTYWLSGDKEGYSGVGMLSKEKPIKIEYGIGIPEHDNEGRVITAEFEKFYLVGVYVPNAGRGLVRLDYRQKWDKDFCACLKKLDSEKPVVLCGDLNVAHEEIDLANPKTNKKNAGFTKEEREGFSNLLKENFVDSFRHLYPEETEAYTFWTYMMNCRAKNVGWRLDYFVLSERLCEKLCDNVIRKDVFGSDHCPITLFLSF